MLRFVCENCGDEKFYARRAVPKPELQCSGCDRHYDFIQFGWLMRQPTAYEKLIREFKIIKNFAEEKIQTSGEWLKEHGILKEKKQPLTSFHPTRIHLINPTGEMPNDETLERELLLNKWKKVLDTIHSGGTVYFGKHEHYGKLRGKSIAIAARRDLKRLGIKTHIKFHNYGAIMETTK